MRNAKDRGGLTHSKNSTRCACSGSPLRDPPGFGVFTLRFRKFHKQRVDAILAEFAGCGKILFYGDRHATEERTENRCYISGSLPFTLWESDVPCSFDRYIFDAGGRLGHRHGEDIEQGLVRLTSEENRYNGVSGSPHCQRVHLCRRDLADFDWRAKNAEGCTSSAFSLNRRIAARGYRTHVDVSHSNRTGRERGDDGRDCVAAQAELIRVFWYLLAMQSLGAYYLIALQIVVGWLLRLCFLRFDTGYASVGRELSWQIVRGLAWTAFTMIGLNWLKRPASRRLQTVGGRRYSLGVRVRRNPVRCHGILFALLLANAHAIDTIRTIQVPGPSSQFHNSTINGDAVTIPAGCQTAWPHEYDLQRRELRYLEGDVVLESAVDSYVYPLPNTIGEAMQNPRRLRLFPDWEDTTRYLIEHGYEVDALNKFETYGIRDHDIGRRSLRTSFTSLGTIIQAIESIWRDEIGARNFQVFLLRPQPLDLPIHSVGLLVEIYTGMVDIDFFAPIMLEVHTYVAGMSDIALVQRTDYLRRSGTATHIYELAAVANLCTPVGNHHCVIELLNGISSSADDVFDIDSGFYVVLQITPPSWRQQGIAELVHGLQSLTSAALALVSDPTDPYIPIGTYAVDRHQRPLGRQYFLLHRRLFDDYSAIWNLAAATWQDYIGTSDMQVTFVRPTPQPEVGSTLQLIVEEVATAEMVPILVTYFLPASAARVSPEELGTFAAQVPTPTSYPDIAGRAYPDTQYELSQFRGHVWCEDHYCAFDEWSAAESGAHILIYSEETEGTEYAESSDISDDPLVNPDADIISAATTFGSKAVQAVTVFGGLWTSGRETAYIGAIIFLSGLWSSSPVRHRLPDDPIPGGQGINICPLPTSHWEAMQNRLPRAWIFDFDDLRVLLHSANIHWQQPAIVDTYGLLEHSLGHKRVTVQDLQLRTLTIAISGAWRDYSFQYDLAIRVVQPQPIALTQPQPIITVIVQVLDPFRQTPPTGVPVLIDQFVAADLEELRQTRTIRVAEYLPSPSFGTEVLKLVRLYNSCQPRGLRYCHLLLHGARRDPTDRIQARAGDYITVNTGPLEVNFRGTDAFFYRARRFALEAQRLMTQVFDVPIIEVEIHAVDADNNPRGARVVTLQMSDLVEPLNIWERAIHLWRDRGTTDNSRLIHVDPQPGWVQRPHVDVLHLILQIAPQEDVVPVLFGLTLMSQVTDENAAYTAVHCPTPTTDDRMLQCSRFHRLVRVLNGQFAIYSGYHQIGHTSHVGLTTGSFLTVQVHHRSRMQLLHNLLELLDDQESSETVSDNGASSSEGQGTRSRSAQRNPLLHVSILCLMLAIDDLSGIGLLTVGIWWTHWSNTTLSTTTTTLQCPTTVDCLHDHGRKSDRNLTVVGIEVPLTKHELYSHSAFGNLPPPGNGVVKDFRTGCLESLDAVVVIGDVYYLYDVLPTSITSDQERILRLADHIGPKRQPEQSASIEVPEDTTSALAMLCNGLLRSMPLRPLPDLPWHDSTSKQLRRSVVIPICHGLERLAIYTDGSAGLLYADYNYFEHASWGFVIVGWNDPNYPTVVAMDSGHVQADPLQEDWAGATRLSAMAGERAALIAAAVWLLRSGYRGTAVFRFDSVAAGYGASGQWNVTPGPNDATLMRVVFQILELQQGLQIRYEHVKAHTGEPWNECANTLAYQAWTHHKLNAVLDFDVRTVLCGDRPLCMQWPMLLDASCGVDFSYGYLTWYRDSAEPRPEVVWSALPQQTERSMTGLNFRLASYNVCSLQERTHALGIADFLRQQMVAQHLDVIGLQETRASKTQVVKTRDFTRYIAAADDGGKGGTEIWLATKGRFASTIRHKQTVVLHHDPERLLLRLAVGGEELCMLSAHAPHAGRGHKVISEWWECTMQLHRQYVGQKSCILLIDANAHFQTPEVPCVGTVGLENIGNYCAKCFGDFLQVTQLFLPSTFAEFHEGQTATWRHPARGTLHRCDYIAVPQGWYHYGLHSWVDGCLDTGRPGIDHIAVILACDLPWCFGGRRQDWPSLHVDRAAIQRADNVAIGNLLDRLPKYCWDVNIHEQASMMVTDLQGALQQAFPTKQKPPRAGYISEAAWQLRAQRRQYRRRLFLTRVDYGRALCPRIFYIWKHWTARDIDQLEWHQNKAVETAGDLMAKLLVHALGHKLKQQLAADRSKHLASLADEAATCAPSAVYNKLRALGVCGKRRRREITPLPVLGEGQDHDDAHARWRQHFEELEDGIMVDPTQLLMDCDRVQRSRKTILPQFYELPTLLELEHAFRLNVKGKACFFDGIPTELAHAHPQYLARYIFPMALKQSLLIAEPVTLKGGILIHAFKGKGCMGQCDNYRSLMISSIFAKSIHRVLRRQSVGHLAEIHVPGQLGGLPGKAVSQAAHILLAWSSHQKARHRSTAVLFVDVRQAFYRLLRAHLTLPNNLDDDVARLFNTLHLPVESFQQFAEEINNAQALQSSGMSEYMEAQLTEVLHGTWFALPGDARVSRTRKEQGQETTLLICYSLLYLQNF